MADKEYSKNYYLNNKERIRKGMKEMKHCDLCNKDVQNSGFQRHCRSKKHLEAQKKGSPSFVSYEAIEQMVKKILAEANVGKVSKE